MDSIQSSDKDETLNRKCKKHPHMLCDILNIDPQVNQNRICTACMREQRIPFDQVAFIREILILDPSSNYSLNPLVNQEESQKLFNSDSNFESAVYEVKKYFSILKDDIIDAIGKVVEEEINKIQKLAKDFKESQSLLKGTISIKKIQDLLLSQEPNSDDLLNEHIKYNFTESKKRFDMLKNKLDEIEASQKQFSPKYPYLIKEKILSMISEIQFFNLFNLQKIQCIPSKHKSNSDKYLKIEKQAHNIVITNGGLSNTNSLQCYFSKQFEQEKKYIIQLELNNSVDQPFFRFGLISEANKDNQLIEQDQVFYHQNVNWGTVSKIIKGKSQESKNARIIGTKSFEFRICIKERLFQVCSLPNYENIQELNNKNNIDIEKIYYFAISIANPGDSVRILKMQEVNSFD